MQSENKNPHLLIVGPLDFPGFTASSSRIKCYGRGIVENGGSATVFSYRPCHSRSGIAPRGTVDGINYLYTSGRALRPRTAIAKMYYEIVGFFNVFVQVYKLNKIKPIDSILFYSKDTILGFFLSRLSQYLKIPLIEEKCEFHFRNRCNIKIKIKSWIYEKIVVPCFDGAFIMTDALADYYKPLMRKNAKVLKMPILVDMKRFELKYSNINEEYIAYCGSPSGDKDGVPILIRAFAKVSKKYSNLSLKIIGNYPNVEERKRVQQFIDELKLSGKVEVTGKKTPEEVAAYLTGAKLLALARPDNFQAKYGFPTKLGEYLATANPVVVTDVGEIAKFLQDGVSAYIAKPDNVNDFAEKMISVLSDYKMACRVGVNGKQVAEENFSYKQHGKRIVDFILEMRAC